MWSSGGGASTVRHCVRLWLVKRSRFIITLPDRIADKLRWQARSAHRSMSSIVAEAVDERFTRLMIEGYKESAALNLRLAEEALPAVLEIWPES